MMRPLNLKDEPNWVQLGWSKIISFFHDIFKTTHVLHILAQNNCHLLIKVEKYKYFTLNILGHPKSYGASSCRIL